MTASSKKETSTQRRRTGIKDVVTRTNHGLGDLPACPVAQKDVAGGKGEFLELDGIGEFGTIFTHIWDFDFDEKDVLILIAEPDQYTAKETVDIADKLNFAFMPRDIVILEDHPKIKEKVKQVKLNNGHYILFLAQRLSKLNRSFDAISRIACSICTRSCVITTRCFSCINNRRIKRRSQIRYNLFCNLLKC